MNYNVNPMQLIQMIQNYNLKDFLMAIAKAGKRGWIWPATVGFEKIGKWSDAKIG